ncbi:MAG: DNA-3-methyladenine glycosylase family protein [Christensenellales bacterium]
MKYEKKKNQIKVLDLGEFDITQILECGQIFSYEKLGENHFFVYSADKVCEVVQNEEFAQIFTKDVDYFINFFDLDENYCNFKQKLRDFDELKDALEYGYGIRILKQDIFEMFVSFVISANNNIPRIKNSIKYIREHAGKNMGDYFAFPTLMELAKYDVEFFVSAGLGYRAAQLVKLLGQLKSVDIEELKQMDTESLRKFLITLSGIGPKVADCILLFGFSRKDVFPVDTWIAKIFHDKFGDTDNRNEMREELIKKFGDLSGVAQQYLFYHKRQEG